MTKYMNPLNFTIFALLNLCVGASALAGLDSAVSPTYAHTQPFWAVDGTLHGAALVPLPSLAWFEWGPTMSYGQTTAPLAVQASAQVAPVRAVLTNLVAGQVYHARLVVSNATGLTFGGTSSSLLLTTNIRRAVRGN
jgi:hypothetical protein